MSDVPETLDAHHSVLEQPPCDDPFTCFSWFKDRDLFDPFQVVVVCGRHLQHSEKFASLTTASQSWSLSQVATSETKHQLGNTMLPCVPTAPKEPHNSTMDAGISSLDLPDIPSKYLTEDQVPPGDPLGHERQGAYDTPYLMLPHHENESGPWSHVATVLDTPPQSPVLLKSKISASRASSHPSWRFSYNTRMPSDPSECTRDSSSVVPMDFCV